ncbi:tetratricopeptide repeat protein 21B-like [Malaya genurostris]|uniref:tetratricopeptide repeat protein 21B-like n=1 Tax=Malaya genurostris TaxID=325434 RepID=UPI0026F3AFA5|nr:tetratricopeptide repeat protein 21B-like [Malaya genurostris]
MTLHFTLIGWCELYLNKNRASVILVLFNEAVEHGMYIDASIGQVRCHQRNNDFEKAISVLNCLSVRYPNLNIPLVEKMKCHLSSWNYYDTMETATMVLTFEPSNLEALQVKILMLIVKDGNYAEKAHKIAPTNPDYITELGYQCILMQKYKEATKWFKTTSKIDNTSLYALCGLTLCQVMDTGVSEQVLQQIEFLSEIQGENKMPLLLSISSKIHQDDPEKAMQFLIEASEYHFRSLSTLPYGLDYLRELNPDFLLELVKEWLKYSPADRDAEMISTDTFHPALRHSANILDAVIKACPGFVEGLYLLAKVQFLTGDLLAAMETLHRIVNELEATYTDAHLLIAQIHIEQKHYTKAAQCLEICLSIDFKVRDHAIFHSLQGIILKNQQLYEDSLKSFLTAMSICGINHNGNNPMNTFNSESNRNSLNITDLLALYFEVINMHVLLNQQSEALKLMQIVSAEFSSTFVKGRVAVALADFYMQLGNFRKAVDLLETVSPNEPYYIRAKTKTAHFYLEHKKDRLAYAQCFKELVSSNPVPSSYLMLGDAYMHIQEPDDAIEAYKQAHKFNSKDILLISKLGRAYVKTHQYKKAISYYQEVIETPGNSSLKLDLAELFLKLKQYSNAEQILVDEIELSKSEADDITRLQNRTKQLLLLARIREKAGYLPSSLNTLKEARDNQYKILKRMLMESNFVQHEQNKILVMYVSIIAFFNTRYDLFYSC